MYRPSLQLCSLLFRLIICGMVFFLFVVYVTSLNFITIDIILHLDNSHHYLTCIIYMMILFILVSITLLLMSNSLCILYLFVYKLYIVSCLD